MIQSKFPEALADQRAVIERYCRDEGLEFFPVVFEIVDFDHMNQIAAYGGFPQRYPHWRFGMEYERLRKQHVYGLGKIYEMVINNDPCYAYLLADNTMVDQKTVMAHVFAHCDFFRNNIWFRQTNRRMMDEMANHATRVRRHIERYGLEAVEQFIDTCLSLENLIDPYTVLRAPEPAKPRPEEDERVIEQQVLRYPAKRYMDRFINPPEQLRAERERLRAERKKEKTLYPPKPVRDVLLFLLSHAPLEDWQADLLAMIREEAVYYAPQGQTKIMNEGWATYWHSTIMTRYALRDEEVVTYCDHHSGTVATSPGRLNPYKMGLELFRDIEYRWNTGRYGKDYDECENMEQRRHWGRERERELPERVVGKESPGREKIFEVRKTHNDVTFIDEFLTPEFIERQNLYHSRYDPATKRMVVVDRDFNKIKKQLLFALTNHAQPYIYVVDGNYANRGELYLAHKYTGVDIQMKYANETLKRVHTIWGRPVHLQALVDDEMILLSYDGHQTQQQTITEDLPKPAHQV
jgi:stage V sporulation protein R